MEIAKQSPATQNVWCQMLYGTTLYNGSLVCVEATSGGEGVVSLPQAAGASNTTNKDIPLGVVIGNNLRTPLFDTTENTGYITSATCHGSTTEFVSHGASVHPMGGREHLVKVALIQPNTILRSRIYNAAVGTAPTVVTGTAGNTSGVALTTDAADATTVAQYSTIYFRTGANMGVYRVLDSASTTTHTWDTPTYADTAVGDTAVVINGLRPFGVSRMQTSTNATYIDCSEALTTNYYMIEVVKLDLSTAGNEFVEFRFNMDNFCYNRA